MVKYLIVILLTSVISYASTLTSYVNQLAKLTPQQINILNYTIKKGKEHKVGYLLAAIAWKESNLGLWRTNLDDGKYGSFSIYHILLEYYLKKNDIQDTSWNRSRTAEKLMDDEDLATVYVIDLLTHWSKVHKTSITSDKVIKSYNAGSNTKTNKAQSYYNDINLRLQAIEIHVKNSKNVDIAKK